MLARPSLVLAVLAVCAAVDAVPAPPNVAPAPAFPWKYDWDKFPAAWFGANGTDWESAEQIAAIGKYSMAILGWQHLDNMANWTAVVYVQLAQAAIIKEAHPNMPVFVYCGFGFAFGLNAPTFAIMNDPDYSDYFLQAADGYVYTDTNCQQAHTSPAATGGRCVGHFWNFGNSSARDYFVEELVAPLAASNVIDGVFYDAFNYGYDIPEVTPWGKQTVNVPNCSKDGGCESLLNGTLDVAKRTATMLNAHGKVPMYANVGTFERPTKGQHIWLDEARLISALEGLSWMSYYESARAETMLSGCPAGEQPGTGGWCLLDNMLTESARGVAGAAHTYLHNDTENQEPHMAAFLLSRAENWYYFGSTGWWDDSYRWDALYDKASACGRPREPPPASGAGTGPLYSRKFEHCSVVLNCTQLDFCRGSIDFS